MGASILTLGLGSFGSTSHILTLGLSSAVLPLTVTHQQQVSGMVSRSGMRVGDVSNNGTDDAHVRRFGTKSGAVT
jgi:hypothetical protein